MKMVYVIAWPHVSTVSVENSSGVSQPWVNAAPDTTNRSPSSVASTKTGAVNRVVSLEYVGESSGEYQSETSDESVLFQGSTPGLGDRVIAVTDVMEPPLVSADLTTVMV